ncbi:5-(carboxyamino)imidazole ribonucleotide synthase [Hahella aquimaris]|uniref:5-(carboxyamino)imidazole ribonucleotide synthase n=1 Tax=Hahella sp. HNIBRBA332 TaxID=3015983 RepID=UPI00273ABEC4|nr:5-(carboxyamino)imidazole ribonucleotide synthase [Hahella sp. HNIBRBA332]WLQ15210.1 5-(carboxyamino)imidazole ribonucleotide synthase [Hahella sp. HNIBRBA332]
MKRIGILGAGQLGRMMALAGMPLGFEFALYDTSGAPSAGLGTIFSDPDNTQSELDRFLDFVDVVTYEFEHLPLDLAQNIAARKPLYPGVEALRVCQNREHEKALFTQLGIPTPKYRLANSPEELAEAARELGTPVVAKSITEGYDGKGQAVLKSAEEAEEAWNSIGHPRLIVESFVNFSREISIIAARSSSGETVTYPLAENIHHGGILRYTIAPAPRISAELAQKAAEYIEKLMAHLSYVGVLALELFETPDGLLANEMAPRVHNSGHWSMNGAHTGQFENHLRAVAGLPLGDTQPVGVSCMINLIGRHADRESVLTLSDTHLHLYGKEERAGRKLGHINIVAEDYKALIAKVEKCLPFVPEHTPFTSSLAHFD